MLNEFQIYICKIICAFRRGQLAKRLLIIIRAMASKQYFEPDDHGDDYMGLLPDT